MRTANISGLVCRMCRMHIDDALRVSVIGLFSLFLLAIQAIASPQIGAVYSPNTVKVTVARELIFDKTGNARFVTHRIASPRGSYATPPNAIPASQSAPARQRSTAIEIKPASGQYYVQLGAFQNASNATRLQRQISHSQQSLIHKDRLGAKTIYKVLIGPVGSRQRAKSLQKTIIGTNGLSAAYVVTLSENS